MWENLLEPNMQLLAWTFCSLVSHGQETGEIIISRSVSFNNSITQQAATCGDTIIGLMTIEINSEPGTERTIALEFEPNKEWVTIQASSAEFDNELVWTQYVQRDDLRVSLSVVLEVPGCEPATDITVGIKGTFEGGTCEEETTVCTLTLPDTSITFVTAKPRMGSLAVSPFNVIRNEWTKPVQLMIPYQLLEPETVTITPVALLAGALTFKARPNELDTNVLQFSYDHPYFPRRTYMYVKAREDLALGQELQIEYGIKCSQCKYNQFPATEDPQTPTVVAEAPKQQFVPLFIPSMKSWHKYCFQLQLNRKPMTEVSVVFEVCSQMTIEPREVVFSKAKDDSMRQMFCITPVMAKECVLRFFLSGQSVENYVRPDPITIYSYSTESNGAGNGTEPAATNKHYSITVPTTIEVTNRKISTPQRLEWEPGGHLDITLTPQLSNE